MVPYSRSENAYWCLTIKILFYRFILLLCNRVASVEAWASAKLSVPVRYRIYVKYGTLKTQ